MPYKNLDQLNCFSKLKEAASLNYTEPEEALFKNIEKKHITSPYLSFNYSYSQCNKTLLTQFETWLEESHLYEQFQNMIDQKIINYSENRAVSHHQYRIQQSNESRDIDTLKKYCKTLRDTWKTENTLHKKAIVHIGIGGSESGPKACYHALKHLYSDVVPIYFLSNLDAIALEGIIKQIDPKESLFILVSKSGSTLETKENYQRLAKALSSTLSPEAFEKQSILITTPNSPLDQHYKKAKRFYFQKEVGGRFSLLSPVGFVSLALSFGETVVDELITGARSIDQMCIQKQPLSKNIPLLAACISTWQTSFLGYNSHVVAPYSTLLFDFSLYIQQLICESLGKSSNQYEEPISYPTSELIIGSCGTNAQHAFFQLLHQGHFIAPTQFICIAKTQSSYDNDDLQSLLNTNAVAQMIALSLGNESASNNKLKSSFSGARASSLFILPSLNPQSLGALISCYENIVSYRAILLNINAYDQPGVELGKLLANETLQKPNKDSLIQHTLNQINIASPK